MEIFDAFIDFFNFCQCGDSVVFGFVIVKGGLVKCIHKISIQMGSFIGYVDLPNYGLIP